ncbi:enoyl-CoA hydratase/isomerase family protein [bacterium]|nr:enoyl-CoA hydratase/isomerase family protein [bacterium]
MSAERAGEQLYAGAKGYVTVSAVEHNGKHGAVLRYVNPNRAKLHAVDTDGMLEMEEAIAVLEQDATLEFGVFTGAYDVIHAGADITEFKGDCDVDAIHKHLSRGTSLDTRVKALWPRMRTIGVFTGDRYGGSVEWPLFAEWGICDKDTLIQLSEVLLGIIPGWNGVLNIMLKCGPERAKWMGQTGNTLRAEDMLKFGIVQQVVETPDAPDRKAVSTDDWDAAWQAHVAAAEPMLLEAALELATKKKELKRNSEFPGGAKGEKAREKLMKELQQEIADRTDTEKYRELHDKVAKEASRLRKDDDKDGLKALTKSALKDLVKLGKPLAPLAVKAVAKFVDEWSRKSEDQIFANYEEIGQLEAELCACLMETEHRRIGVNAVLSRNPEDKVPVFD